MQTFKMRQIPALLLSSMAMLSIPIPAALAAQSAALEEVIVTARKREESLQDAPLAVSAFSGEALLRAGVSNLSDITELVPNLQISRPSRDASVYIRGVGPTRGATNVTELSVGVYLDDVFLLKPQGQLMDLADIESVQVLRGPQGTLFGKNTTGGALLVTTKKPSEEFEGYGQATVGNEGQVNVQGSINVPLSDTVFGKLTVTSVQADGGYEDPNDGTDLSDSDRQGAFAQLRWLASDDVTVDLNFFHNRIRENMLAGGDCVNTNPDSVIASQALITPASGLDFLSDFCDRASDSVAPYDQPQRKYKLDASMASAAVDWEIDEDHSFRSITGWVYQETPNIEYTNTFVGFPTNQISLDDGDSTQISQEFQLIGEFMDSALRYSAGLYYMDDDSNTGNRATWNGVNGIWGSITDAVPEGLAFALTSYSELGQKAKNKSYAAYTQWSYDIAENWELTAGLRYSYEERDLRTHRTTALGPEEAFANVPGAIVIPGTGVLMPYDVFFNEATSALPLPLGETGYLQADENFDSLTPMASISYTFPEHMLNDNINGVLTYLSYTEGYKAGGFSDFALGELLPFDEEEIYNIEVGMKLDAMDNRLRINAALFTMNYDNMQLFVARPDPTPDTVGSLQGVTNAGKSTINGAELEVNFALDEHWLFSFAASYADGEFDEFEDFTFDLESGEVIPSDRSDEDLPSLPEKTFNLGIQYDWDTSFGSWTARADAYYRDELYWGFDALTWQIPLARESATTDSFTVFNARLSWQVNDNFSVTAWGKNLGDKTYSDGGVAESQNLGIASQVFAPPRLYGIDVRYEF